MGVDELDEDHIEEERGNAIAEDADSAAETFVMVSLPLRSGMCS